MSSRGERLGENCAIPTHTRTVHIPTQDVPGSFSGPRPRGRRPRPTPVHHPAFLPTPPHTETSWSTDAPARAVLAAHSTPRRAAALPGAPPHPRRIVFLAHRELGSPSAGGSELLVDRLADGLSRQGHEVTLLCGGPAAFRDYRVVSAGGPYDHYLRARSAFARQVGDCDLLVEVCNGMPYFAPLWHRGPTLCLVNHVHTDLWPMRFGGPLAPPRGSAGSWSTGPSPGRTGTAWSSRCPRPRRTPSSASACRGSGSAWCTTGSPSRARAPNAPPNRSSWRWAGSSSTSGSTCCCGCGNGCGRSPAAPW